MSVQQLILFSSIFCPSPGKAELWSCAVLKLNLMLLIIHPLLIHFSNFVTWCLLFGSTSQLISIFNAHQSFVPPSLEGIVYNTDKCFANCEVFTSASKPIVLSVSSRKQFKSQKCNLFDTCVGALMKVPVRCWNVGRNKFDGIKFCLHHSHNRVSISCLKPNLQEITGGLIYFPL